MHKFLTIVFSFSCNLLDRVCADRVTGGAMERLGPVSDSVMFEMPTVVAQERAGVE